MPTDVALAEARKLEHEVDSNIVASLVSQLLVGLLICALGIGILFMVAAQISSPIRKVSQLVTELSESDGDLTTRIHLDVKNELAVMCDGINLFLK